MKQAHAVALASERVAEDSRVQYYNHLRSLYNQAVGLQQSVALYTSSQNSLLTHFNSLLARGGRLCRLLFSCLCNQIQYRMSCKFHKAIFHALLAATLYAVSIPFSKLLLTHLAPTTLAAFLYIGADAGMAVMGAVKRDRSEEPLRRGDIKYTVAMVVLDILCRPRNNASRHPPCLHKGRNTNARGYIEIPYNSFNITAYRKRQSLRRPIFVRIKELVQRAGEEFSFGVGGAEKDIFLYLCTSKGIQFFFENEKQHYTLLHFSRSILQPFSSQYLHKLGGLSVGIILFRNH